MGSLTSTLIASSFVIASSTQLSATEKKLTWSPDALIHTKTISDIQISPDNTSVLFVVTEPNMKEEKGILISRIYKKNRIVEDVLLPFSAPNVSSMQPRWSPDGKWIAFLSTRDEIKELYLIHAHGGEATVLTTGKQDVQTFCWSPDGKKIAFVMSDESEAKKNEKKTSLAYVYNDNSEIHRLWILDVFSTDQTPQALTSDAYCVRGSGDFGTINTEFDWSPDSTKITFAYSPNKELDSFYLDSSLATVDVDTKAIFSWEKKACFEAMPRYSPDGQWIAYMQSDSPTRYSLDRQVAINSVDGKQHRLLAPTGNEGAFLAGPNLLGWSQDGNSLLFFEPKETKFQLVQVPIDGSDVKVVDTGNIFFKDPALSYDRSLLGFVMQTPGTPPEACIATVDDFTPVPMSTINASFLSYPKIDTEAISWTSTDGVAIQGLLTYPIQYDKTKKYPLLLIIHGGPMAFFDETFLGTQHVYPLASFADAGFMILRPNPRGSSGYGKDFRRANYNDWGGSDFRDIMTGIDMLIEQGLVDAEKLGVMGWSYGGYMTAWMITQTSRFKAASIGAGLSNLVSMNGTTDLYRFLTDYLGDSIENRALYENRSPINYVCNVTTPCLIQHGTYDKRVPVSQAYEFYHALNRLGKEVRLVLYPEMEHRISDPKMQLDAMECNLAWFQQHVL